MVNAGYEYMGSVARVWIELVIQCYYTMLFFADWKTKRVFGGGFDSIVTVFIMEVCV